MFSIRRLLFETGKTQSEIGEIMGVPQSVVSNMSKGFRQVRKEHIAKLRAAFGDEMISRCTIPDEEYNAHAGAVTIPATIVPAEVVDEIREEARQEEEEASEMIPIVSAEQAKLPNFDVRNKIMENSPDIKRLSLSDFFDKFGRFDAVSPIYSERMIPTYMPGDFLFIRYLHYGVDSFITEGRYLIDTIAHGSILAKVRDMEDGTLQLTFDNARRYSPMTLLKTDISSIAEIVVMMRMGDMAFDVADTANLQLQLEKKDEQFASVVRQMDKMGDRVSDVIQQNEKLINTLVKAYEER